MDVFLFVGVRRRAVGVLAFRRSPSRCADGERSRDRHLDHVASEIRVELRVRVELVAVPAARRPAAPAGRLVHPDFREPLAHQIEVAEVAGPREHPRQLCREDEVECHRAAGRHRRRERDAHHRLVFGILIVRLLESHRPGEIGAILELQRIDLNPSPVVLPLGGAAELSARLFEERRVRALERVQVQVEPQIRDRVVGRITPNQPLLADQLPHGVIEVHADSVIDDTLGAIGQTGHTRLRGGLRLTGVERRAGRRERGRAKGNPQAHGVGVFQYSIGREWAEHAHDTRRFRGDFSSGAVVGGRPEPLRAYRNGRRMRVTRGPATTRRLPISAARTSRSFRWRGSGNRLKT